jgi:rhodanese-related sulfurtransferase
MRQPAFGILAAAFCLLMAGVAGAQQTHEAPKITKEQLKLLLGKPDLVVLDVRLDEQWRFSNRKIPGAVHENPTVPSTWIDKYPKGKTIVLYCA